MMNPNGAPVQLS